MNGSELGSFTKKNHFHINTLVKRYNKLILFNFKQAINFVHILLHNSVVFYCFVIANLEETFFSVIYIGGLGMPLFIYVYLIYTISTVFLIYELHAVVHILHV